MVSNASEDLPDPETPLTTVSFPWGISQEMFFRLWVRAPRMMMASFKGKHRARSRQAAIRSSLRGSGCRQPFFIIGCNVPRQRVPLRHTHLKPHFPVQALKACGFARLNSRATRANAIRAACSAQFIPPISCNHPLPRFPITSSVVNLTTPRQANAEEREGSTPPSRCERREQAVALLPPLPGPERGKEPSAPRKRTPDTALRSSQRSYSPDRDKRRREECAASKRVS